MARAVKANWDALKAEMRDILIQLARMEETITYSELAAQLRTVTIHYRSPLFTSLLWEVAGDDRREGRPSLATLVVNQTTGRPGAGYFKNGDVVDDPEEYWQKRFGEVCDYWQRR